MKRKSAILLAAAVLVLLAVYGVWHYSPLRHLTKSKSQPGQMQTAGEKNPNQPVVIRKKIPPGSEEIAQQTDIPRPLIVLKDQTPKKAPEPVDETIDILKKADDGTTAQVVEPSEKKADKKTAKPEAETKDSPKIVPAQSKPLPATEVALQPYSIMLASCRLKESANKIVSNYQKAGLTPYIVKVQFDSGDVWLRVFAGHYPTRLEALSVKQKHQLSDAMIKKTPYTNLIGTFSAENEVKDILQRLKKLGYSPYLLKRNDNSLQLVVGAFITKKGAATHQSELKSKGIPNTVVER